MREESMKIMKKNDNLDLDNYKQYMSDFQKFSGNLFDHDSNIFKVEQKDPTEILEMKMKRSIKNESQLIQKDYGKRALSPVRM